MGACPYEIGPKNPTGAGQNGITLHEGCTYQLTIHNSDDPSQQQQPHELDNGLVAIGVPDTPLVPGQTVVYTITIPTSSGDHTFSCLNSMCSGGNVPLHEQMVGIVHIVP